MNVRHLLVAAVPVIIVGCQSIELGSGQPARIVNADEASRAAVQQAVNTVFGTDVTIAPHALTNSSVLVIERGPQPSMENPNPIGRNMEKPVQLRLVIDETDCILIDTRNNARYSLPNTSCEAE